jgi:hypothetical protein
MNTYSLRRPIADQTDALIAQIERRVDELIKANLKKR